MNIPERKPLDEYGPEDTVNLCVDWADYIYLVCDCGCRDLDVMKHAEFCPYAWLEHGSLVMLHRLVQRKVQEATHGNV